jgi:hypothetical protein
MVWTYLSRASWILLMNDWTALSIDLPFLKPLWASEKILFSDRKGIILLHISHSDSLAKTGIIDTGL